MFSRGLSAAIPTVTAPPKNIVSAGIVNPRNMMIPYGNIRAGHIFQQKMHWGIHRVAVGATGRSPATHAMHPRAYFRCWCHRGRASTRPYIACCKSTKYTGIASTKIYHRVTPRSCRGDREVARPSAWRAHSHSGVAVTAGELPLAPTLLVVHQ